MIEIAGAREIVFDDIADTDSLKLEMCKRYPGFEMINYVIAVDKQITIDKTVLGPDSQIAVLPPFAGG